MSDEQSIALTQKAIMTLTLKPSADEMDSAAMAFQIHGIHPAYWSKAIENVNNDLIRYKRRATLFKVIQSYENYCEKNNRVACSHCQSSGYVSCLTISGKHNHMFRTYIFDPNEPGRTKHMNFIYAMKKADSPFKPKKEFLPCICENGGKANENSEGRIWLSDEQRQMAIERSFRGPTAEFDLENVYDWIMDIAKGRKPVWKTWKDKPVPDSAAIAGMQKQLEQQEKGVAKK